jgi:hypothetical protein
LKDEYNFHPQGDGINMKLFRFQFTLRTLFLVSFVFAVLFSFVACEIQAKRDFYDSVKAVMKTVTELEPGIDSDLLNSRNEEARKIPNASGISIGPGYSRQTRYLYFYSFDKVNFLKRIIPNNMGAPRTTYDNQTMIDLTIRCSRPWSFLSRKTTISIIVHPALKNDLFLDRWKAKFEKTGKNYEILER